MAKRSAGLLMYRVRDGMMQVLIVHPGGPFWKNKDAGAWTIPKGLVDEGETPLVAAQREFYEEISGYYGHLPYWAPDYFYPGFPRWKVPHD